MNRTVPGSSARRSCSSRAAPTSIAVCASCPHACMRAVDLARELEAGVFGHRQRVHVAAEQHHRPVAVTGQIGDDRRHGRRRCGRRDRARRARRAPAPACAAVRGRARACGGSAAGARRRRAAARGIGEQLVGTVDTLTETSLAQCRGTTLASAARTRLRRRDRRPAARRPLGGSGPERPATAGRRGRARARPRP